MILRSESHCPGIPRSWVTQNPTNDRGIPNTCRIGVSDDAADCVLTATASSQPPLPPPKFVFNDVHPDSPRVGHAMDSLVCSGTIISGGAVERCILSPRVRVNSYSSVTDSILFEGVEVGRHCRIHRAIIDKGLIVPDGTQIGVDANVDRARGLTVTDDGIVAVARNVRF